MWLWPTGKLLSGVRCLSPAAVTWLLIDSTSSLLLYLFGTPTLPYSVLQ